MVAIFCRAAPRFAHNVAKHRCGVRVMALCDHDTLSGVRELMSNVSDLPLGLIAGVEINSVATGIEDLWEGELHILGLGVDPQSDAFEATLARQRDARAERFRSIVARLRALGMPVDDGVEKLGSVPGSAMGRPQIARLLVDAGFAPTVDAAMTELLARGMPAYVPRQGLGPKEAIAAVAAAGGVASLAHFADATSRRDLVEMLKSWGLAALEVHYRHFDAATVAGMSRLAHDMGLISTGGSDYHGDGETYAQAHAALFVPDEDAADLRADLGRRTSTPATAVEDR